MNRTLIIAEAGVNHNGDIEQAKKLIDVATYAEADYVKFQTFKAGNLVSRYTDKAEYQKEATDSDESHYEMIKKLEINREMHLRLIEYCNLVGVKFLSTPFDLDSIDLLVELKMDKLKIPSGEITNLPYLRHIGSRGKELILSTGMSTLKEIYDALNVLIESGLKKDELTILHCNTEYPTPMSDVNLSAMLTIKDELDVKVGYSDHTLGIEVPIAAVALGATVIEKHFTLDRNMPGPDHAASLEPKELKNMISAIRNIEKSLGSRVKTPSNSEMKNIPIARKSIVANMPIKKGEIFSIENLAVKRPGTGISPMRWDEIVGMIADRDYKEEDLIQ